MDFALLMTTRDASRLGHYADEAKDKMQPKVKIRLSNGEYVKVHVR